MIPRWTAYPALAVLATMFVIAVPKKTERRIASEAILHPRIVVVGIDGMDPDILREVMRNHPEGMQNFIALAAEADGVRELGTSTPAQSPVAWSNFATGRNPGGHGIFDFLHSSKESYAVIPSTVTEGQNSFYWLPGKYRFPSSSGGDSNRTGQAFWTMLGDQGIASDIWRMPINFPVETGRGWAFSGMGTPAIDSAYGESTLYTTDRPAHLVGKKKVIDLTVTRGVARTKIFGLDNAFVEPKTREEVGADGKEHTVSITERATAPLDIFVDEDAGAVAVQIDGGDVIVLEPGQWSTFVPVNFSLLPAGMQDVSGIVRFYLRSVTPELVLYASPVNVDPMNPLNPVSNPTDAATTLADTIGLYYTQGMAEDVNGLKSRMITDQEFMRQSQLVYEERGRMLDYALDRYLEDDDGGLLFFYYSSVDLAMHMMWRHGDTEHPGHDPELAVESSTWWSGREGSQWKDVVTDLYLKMDPVLGEIRERVGMDTPIVVMSDHGFAPLRRKFSLNRWLVDEGYLVLADGIELPEDGKELQIHLGAGKVDWDKSRAYGMGFNGLYLNRKGRESKGIVEAGVEADELTAEIAGKLLAIRDQGTVVVTNADLASETYSGKRMDEAPEILVGYNAGYGNSDEASLGQIESFVLADNDDGKSFNGSHLIDPRLVKGVLISNLDIIADDPRLEDLTVSLLRFYGVEPDPEMVGRPVLKSRP
jgi:predicted AlkP superfamily phosphohydrolase/phosphomutase